MSPSGKVPETETDFRNRAEWVLGLGRNANEKNAFAGAGILSFGDVLLGGVELRYRRWLSSSGSAIDLAAGFSRASVWGIGHCYTSDGTGGWPAGTEVCGRSSDEEKVVGHGVRGSAAVMINPYLGVFVRGESLRAEGANHGAVYAGARAGSFATGVAGLAIIVAGMIAVASL
jgi:hypothetical protein